MQKIYQLMITLKGSNPLVWRRIRIKADILLPDLHKVIQTVMGWENTHMHQFIHKNQFYGFSSLSDPDEAGIVDYSGLTLSDLISKKNKEIFYEYDLGDSWEHSIMIEDILTTDEEIPYPVCIDGKRKCPPENCGGIPGYINLLKMSGNQHQHNPGETFDPDYFDPGKVNESLKKTNYGCVMVY